MASSGMSAAVVATAAAASVLAVAALVAHRRWGRERQRASDSGEAACASRAARQPAPQALPVRTPPDLRPKTVIFEAERLRAFCENVFKHFGVPDDDAALAADVLSSADRRGIDSHGIARLHTYVELLQAGRVNPRPNVRVVHETPGTATVDGDNGLGLVVGVKANRIAIAKARVVGTGSVAVRNSNHFGANSYYCLESVAAGMIGLAMTNTTALVAPVGASERMLGTNPLAAAFPAGEEQPVVIDFASSVVSFGKIEIAKRQGVTLPFGWAVDKHGKPTQDPSAAMEGALLPLGSDFAHGGHKGYGLSCLVDLLSGVLSGAAWGPNVPPFSLEGLLASTAPVIAGRGTGHFFSAWRIDAFRPVHEYKADVDAWVRRFHEATPEDPCKPVLVPGDPEHRESAKRRQQGIPVSVKVVEDMEAIVRQTGVAY